MPIQKFRDVSEMADSRWYEPGDPLLFKAISEVWNLAERTCQRRFPPGVYRHRSIEEAQRLRDKWETSQFESYWARQSETPATETDEPLPHPG